MTQFRYDLPGEPVANYSSHGVRSAALAHGHGESHVWLLEFEPGGEIGEHLAGFDQLFFVLEGSAWVVVNGQRFELSSGEGATVDLRSTHSKGSLGGARVLMVQIGALDWPRELD